jgi:2-methylcitrate dehydratase PrpD
MTSPSDDTPRVTAEVARFVRRTTLHRVPKNVLDLAKGHILDGLGVALAGSVETCSTIARAHIRAWRAKGEATVIGSALRVPAEKAAFLNGLAAHALDYDDTQLSTSKDAVYGLLTHPTTPVLSSALAAGEVLGASGRDVLLAYVVAVEAECRLSDAMSPRHYQAGFHSTGTVGHLGAVLAVGKLLDLDEPQLCQAMGLAASMAAGLRENFGTMTKPYHAGRACEDGVIAAFLVKRGFTAATNILEAKRGFYSAFGHGGGFEAAKIRGRLGAPYFFLDPGVSIKPYPSGSLSHPAQDAILDLVTTHDLRPQDVARIDVGTNSNIPNALIHPMPKTELEAKFSIPFCMAVAVVERKAGLEQFTDDTVRRPAIVKLMKRVTLSVDPDMEALGFDLARAVVKVTLKNGRVLEQRVDLARGTPPNRLSWEELAEKFRECAGRAISTRQAEAAIAGVQRLEAQPRVSRLLAGLGSRTSAR